jgi:hypothetical protein
LNAFDLGSQNTDAFIELSQPVTYNAKHVVLTYTANRITLQYQTYLRYKASASLLLAAPAAVPIP